MCKQNQEAEAAWKEAIKSSMEDNEEDDQSDEDREYTHYDLYKQLKRNTKSKLSRGGRMNMRIVDKSGLDTGFELAEEIRIKDYSFPATVALPDGNFLVLH